MIKFIGLNILTMFGIGYSKYIPGTIASFITSLIYILLFHFKVNFLILILFLIFITFISIILIDKLNKYFKEIDAKEIVIDEFIGQSIPILIFYSFISFVESEKFFIFTLISFIFFRFFDILKPYPINLIDKNMKSGFGVILDDIVAGLFSIIGILLISLIFIYV
jgi:phosphatidylglycerophosphatase A